MQGLPVVGLGIYRGFDEGPGSPAYRQLQSFAKLGADCIDL